LGLAPLLLDPGAVLLQEVVARRLDPGAFRLDLDAVRRQPGRRVQRLDGVVELAGLRGGAGVVEGLLDEGGLLLLLGLALGLGLAGGLVAVAQLGRALEAAQGGVGAEEAGRLLIVVDGVVVLPGGQGFAGGLHVGGVGVLLLLALGVGLVA